MTKKKTTTKPKPADKTDEAVADSAIVIPEIFTVRKWKGRDRFYCSACPMDFWTEAEMKVHFERVHLKKGDAEAPKGGGRIILPE